MSVYLSGLLFTTEYNVKKWKHIVPRAFIYTNDFLEAIDQIAIFAKITTSKPDCLLIFDAESELPDIIWERLKTVASPFITVLKVISLHFNNETCFTTKMWDFSKKHTHDRII